MEALQADRHIVSTGATAHSPHTAQFHGQAVEKRPANAIQDGSPMSRLRKRSTRVRWRRSRKRLILGERRHVLLVPFDGERGFSPFLNNLLVSKPNSTPVTSKNGIGASPGVHEHE
jgi:hypothetical protein